MMVQKRKTLLNSLTNNKIFENKNQGIELLNKIQINENPISVEDIEW